MTLARVLVTPITNLKELILVTHDDSKPAMNSYRSLILDSLFSYVIESIYRDLYAEADELNIECIKESYDDVLNKDSDFHHYNLSLDYEAILVELEKVKEQLMYIIATEGLLSNMTFHTAIISSSTIKILIYDISPITRPTKEVQ